MKKLIYLEWARGIAALLVVLHHATLDAPAFYNDKPFANFFYFGMAGVDFFFVLSGFIIYYIHSEDPNTYANVKRYLLKRLIRVYPPFLFVSSILLMAYLFVPFATERSDFFDIEYLLKSFLLLPLDVPPLLTVSWTLVHEMFFYILFITIILNKKIGMTIFLVWAGVIVLLNVFVQKIMFPYSFILNLHNLEFLFGILVAYIFKENKNSLKNNTLVYLTFSALLLFVLNGINQNYHMVEFSSSSVIFIYGLSSAMIIYGLVHLKNYYYKTRWTNLLSLLGAASYSIYLLHVPLLSVLHRIVSKLSLEEFIHPNLIFIFLVVLAVIGGVIMHLIVEKPVTLYLRNRLIK